MIGSRKSPRRAATASACSIKRERCSSSMTNEKEDENHALVCWLLLRLSRGGVRGSPGGGVEPWSNANSMSGLRPTTPALRATPPLRGGGEMVHRPYVYK